MNRLEKICNRTASYSSLITIAILLIAWLAGFSSRLFAVIRFESLIHNFDPWFNYRATAYMVQHGVYKFLNWFDERAWYPLGRMVGGTVYPGLMITSGSIHYLLHALNIPVHIRDICVFLGPVFSGLTAISTYLLTKELWSCGAGLFAASFIAIVPGYISRSSAGSYDNEAIAIFAMQFTYFLWVRAIKTGSVFWSTAAALSYFYMVSAWGGYIFIINLIPLHVVVLLIIDRYSLRLLTSYCTFFIIGLILSMQNPIVGFQPLKTSEHMAAIGVFFLLLAVAVLKHLQRVFAFGKLRKVFIIAGLAAAAVIFLGVVTLTVMGIVAPWSGRFYSLWDTAWAKTQIPLIASVSEHQPTSWFSLFSDLHILACAFPVGLWYCVQKINDVRAFVVLYAISALYFAGVMIRLILTLTPVVCMLAGIAFSNLLKVYFKSNKSGSSAIINAAATNVDDENEAESKNENPMLNDNAGKLKNDRMKDDNQQLECNNGLSPILRSIVVLTIILLLMMFAVHCTFESRMSYSNPSIVLAFQGPQNTYHIIDDFREAYYWLSQNTKDDARVMSWWDYGYQIAGMANRTTLVDNNTWNNSHIALVGKAMASTEEKAYEIMTALNVDYVLVIFSGVLGFNSDDINKFLWMVRIAQGEYPKEIIERDYFTDSGEFRIDAQGSPTLLNCLMYKLIYYQFGMYKTDPFHPAGYDRKRQAVIGNKDFELTYLEEAYTTENWLVRIYRVKNPNEFNRPTLKSKERMVSPRNFVSRKNLLSRRGYIKNGPIILQDKRT